MTEHPFMEQQGVLDLCAGMARALQRQLKDLGRERPLVIGIRTGGVWIAEALHLQLGIQEPLGRLDISFYRDDFTRIGMNPQVRPSEIPWQVNSRHLILVDDVIQSGRTLRAALNEIFDFGRPASVLLACLVDRGGRELPVHPDVAGIRPTLSADQHIRLMGPDPLSLVVRASHYRRHQAETDG